VFGRFAIPERREGLRASSGAGASVVGDGVLLIKGGAEGVIGVLEGLSRPSPREREKGR
jgi:hypothetical protein